LSCTPALAAISTEADNGANGRKTNDARKNPAATNLFLTKPPFFSEKRHEKWNPPGL